MNIELSKGNLAGKMKHFLFSPSVETKKRKSWTKKTNLQPRKENLTPRTKMGVMRRSRRTWFRENYFFLAWKEARKRVLGRRINSVWTPENNSDEKVSNIDRASKNLPKKINLYPKEKKKKVLLKKTVFRLLYWKQTVPCLKKTFLRIMLETSQRYSLPRNSVFGEAKQEPQSLNTIQGGTSQSHSSRKHLIARAVQFLVS